MLEGRGEMVEESVEAVTDVEEAVVVAEASAGQVKEAIAEVAALPAGRCKPHQRPPRESRSKQRPSR